MALSPSEAAKIATEVAADDSLRATRADVKKYRKALLLEINRGNDSAAMYTLFNEATEMLHWDEADLPSRESLTWEYIKMSYDVTKVDIQKDFPRKGFYYWHRGTKSFSYVLSDLLQFAKGDGYTHYSIEGGKIQRIIP